ncbi:hypothetical protein [Nonomuraea rhodomycinica]|uniref:Uncharacterized protein n=1 Tax=Nonomuraea rhodomycinica TaxID=1712872 RepID=A0A7Y6IYX2_9ACTN|nr:hypothetical protein [Nonomuraea rhodomycinica]NUW46994.1 hypothetical protein [Nonomuraea rhodomycinica]
MPAITYRIDEAHRAALETAASYYYGLPFDALSFTEALSLVRAQIQAKPMAEQVITDGMTVVDAAADGAEAAAAALRQFADALAITAPDEVLIVIVTDARSLMARVMGRARETYRFTPTAW